MSLEFPSWLEWLGWVIGADWPAGDEDAMRRLSDAWTAMGTALGDASDNGDQSADLVMTALDAADGRAFDKTWSVYSGDDEAYLSKLKEACDGLAKLCEGCAEDIEYAKYTFYVMLALLAIDIAIMVAAAAATFGGSLAEIAIEEGLTQLAARRVATMVVEKIAERTAEKAAEFSVKQLVKEGIKGTLKGELPDFVAQVFMTAQGDEKGGWNFNRTGNSVLSAGTGAVLGAGADALGNKTGLGRRVFGDNPFGQAAKGTVTGGATPFLTGAMTGQPASWHDIAEGATGGAAGGALGFAKGKAVEWYKSRPDGGHVALPDADRSETLLASSSRPVTETSTVDTSTSEAGRSSGATDAGATSPTGLVAHGGSAGQVDSGAATGSVRAGSARSTTHAVPERTRTAAEPARPTDGDSSAGARPRRTVERSLAPNPNQAHDAGAAHDAHDRHRTVGGSEQPAIRHSGDERAGARHGSDGGASADRSRPATADGSAAADGSRQAGADGGPTTDRSRQAGPDPGEPGRPGSRTTDTAGAQHGTGDDRTATPSRASDAPRATDPSRGADRPTGPDDARQAPDRARAANESQASPAREETHDRAGRGSAPSVNRIDAVLNPPARPARTAGSGTPASSDTTGTTARRTSVPAPGPDTTAVSAGRNPAQDGSHTSTPAHTDRRSTPGSDPADRARDDSVAGRASSPTAADRAAPEVPDAAPRPTTSPETIENLGYDRHSPGFPDPGDGINTVHHEGREWVRLEDDAGWHRVEFRSTDERYTGKGFAARLKTFVDKYFHGHDGRTAEDLFNEARGKLAYEIPERLPDRYQEATDEETTALTRIRGESRFRTEDDLVIQKVLSDPVEDGYLGSGWGTVGGFVAKLVDVVHLSNPAKIFSALRLDYPESQFSSTQESVTVLRTRIDPTVAERNLFAPGSAGTVRAAARIGDGQLSWQVHEASPPFSGSGFTADPTDGVPEFLIGGGPGYGGSIPLTEGAEIWHIGANGNEELVAAYHGERWIHMNRS